MGATPPLMRGRGGPRLVVPVEEPYRINHRIRVPEVRVIVENEEGEEQNLGVMATPQALRMAEERDLDLVEVAPQAQPPVCKIMDYGRFKYSVERKAREAKRAGQAGRAASEMKDVQLSPRIDDHDRQFKVERARGFLSEGHPVRMVVRFLGRDMRHPEVGMKALQEALEELGKMLPITVDQQPRMEGRQLFALVRLAKGAKLPSERANGAARAEAADSGDAAVAPPAEPAVPAAPAEPAVPAAAPAGEPPAETAPAAAETPVPLAEPVRAAS
jgi:translation initiation factor IF-3